jgi:hypothetical protein
MHHPQMPYPVNVLSICGHPCTSLFNKGVEWIFSPAIILRKQEEKFTSKRFNIILNAKQTESFAA